MRRVSSSRPPGGKYKHVCMGVALVVAVVVLWRQAGVHAQSSDQLTIYSAQTTYSASVIDVKGIPYVGLVDVMEPLGSVDGWILRDVRRGTALIEGRMGIIEVDQGDILPGLGRIDAIRKQADGRWVVVTTRGLIMPPH